MSDAKTFGVDISPLGDQTVLVELGTGIHPDLHRRVQALCHLLERAAVNGVIEWVPAYNTVAVSFDSSITSYQVIARQLASLLPDAAEVTKSFPRVVEIPVCYEEPFGPDLLYVAEQANLTPKQVVDFHTGPDYLVYMIGFAPGFPYLGGMDKRISAPRKDVVRNVIPAGSVGIAGAQTGIYPISTPGGWQLIGRTPLRLFNATKLPPVRVEMGDIVRFQAISREQFEQLQEVENETSGT